MGTVEDGEDDGGLRSEGWAGCPTSPLGQGTTLSLFAPLGRWEAQVEEDKGTRVIVCLRCQLEFSVTIDDRGLHLSYDIEHWIKRCCCKHRVGPFDCCSFLVPEGMLSTWPRSPKG
jgi:hypothetical protein